MRGKAARGVLRQRSEQPKRSSFVIDRIIASVMGGRLKPGDHMPSIEALAQQFGVGRTSVREALVALELVGIVELRHGGGTFVRADVSGFFLKPLSWSALLDQSKIAALAETRRCMESELAAMAAQRATPEEVRRSKGNFSRWRRSAISGRICENRPPVSPRRVACRR